MSKQRRTVSLEEAVDGYLSREEVNASALVNQLVKQHMNGGASDEEILRFRKQQVKSEYTDLAERTKRKLEELNELRGRENKMENEKQQAKQEQWDEAVSHFSLTKLASMDEPVLDATEDELREWSEKLDMTTAELKDRLYTELMEENNA